MATSFNGPAEIVQDAYTRSVAMAATTQAQLATFTAALTGSFEAVPTIDVTWSSLDAPAVPDMPSMPALPAASFTVPDGQPAPMTGVSLDGLDVDDFDFAPPTIHFPTAPSLNYGVVPGVPSIQTPVLPDAPELVMPGLPSMLSLSTPTLARMDLRADAQERLLQVPQLDLLRPAPLTHTRGPGYESALLEALKAVLAQRIQGGTGLAPAVEQAIWDRARDRETKTALAAEQDVLRASEGLGFPMPAGVTVSQLERARRDAREKLSTLSRDIAIKQADMEQQNLRESIAQAMQLEDRLLTHSTQLEQMAFDMAQATADNAIALHNAAVQQFQALLSAYDAYAKGYRMILDAELAKLEIYKAELQAEQTKAQVNASLVEQYKAQIDAVQSRVQLYQAQLAGAKTLVELEQAKIQAAGEQVRAFIATVNAETAKIEGYKAQVGAEATKADVFKTQVGALTAKSQAQAERARVRIAQVQAMAQVKSAEWDGWKTRVQAESSRLDAVARQSGMLLDGFKATAHATEAKANMTTKIWETKIKEYAAGQDLALQTAKINSANILAAQQSRQDAAKVSTQVYAQLAASAYNIVATSASISGGVSENHSYSYQGGD